MDTSTYNLYKEQTSKKDLIERLLPVGFIPTPYPLVEEIVDSLGKKWDNNSERIIDQACGRGAFLFVVKHRLMTAGISEQHIVEHMLYGVDIDPRCVEFTKALINPTGKYKDNITCANALTLDMNMKFDVVIGNPPYQDSDRKSKVGSGSTLWIDFALKAHALAKPDGVIAYVTPQSWMKPNHKVLNLMKKNTLTKVVTTIKTHFPGVNSTFSYWILQNTPHAAGHMTNVDGLVVDLQQVPYLVTAALMPVHKKLVFDTKDKFNVEVDWTTAHTQQLSASFKTHNMSRTQTPHCMYPVYHTNAQTLYCANKTKHFDDKKVMFTDSGYLKPFYDNGATGSTERCKFIVVKTEAEGRTLVSVLSSKIYQFIISTARWSGFTDNTVLKSLPAVDLTRTWTDAELYAHFNLTQEEIDLIEATVK